jgi:20S proteasome alpha/beta subunit
MQNNSFDNKKIYDLGTDYIDELEYNEEALTTTLAIKCSDGIVFASDSQSTSKSRKSKTLGVTKIFKINNKIALTGSGDSDHINRTCSEIGNTFSEGILYEKNQFKEILEDLVLSLRKKYNTDRSKKLGLDNIENFFRPICLIGINLKEGFFLYLIRDDGWIEEIPHFIAIGSGSDLANFLLQFHNRGPTADGKNLSDLEIVYNLFVATYIVNEIKNFDTLTGGITKVGVINNEGFKELSNDEILMIYNTYREGISNSFDKLVNDKNFKKIVDSVFLK